jgi:hypothetical protein
MSIIIGTGLDRQERRGLRPRRPYCKRTLLHMLTGRALMRVAIDVPQGRSASTRKAERRLEERAAQRPVLKDACGVLS